MKNARHDYVISAQIEDEHESGSGTAVISRSKPELKEPSMYKVLLHNDDFTPYGFCNKCTCDLFLVRTPKNLIELC